MSSTKTSFIGFKIIFVVLLSVFFISCEKEQQKEIPTISTKIISDITPTTFICGGIIVSDGGNAIIARGVCWSLNPAPTISDNKTSDGSGNSSFISSIYGLTPGVTYYTRAYATNNIGTAYGRQESAVTLATPIKFEKNVLIEQYTGTWCGYCTRAIAQIDNLMLSDKKIVHVSLHLSDAMTFNLNNSLFQSFGFTGVPTVHADRSVVWNGNISLITPLHNSAKAGLAINVSNTGNTVTATVRVKFGTEFSENLKLSVYLLDNELIANQANYYNTDASSPYYQKGSPIINFVHKNVITKTATDMFGDAIPPASVGTGTIFTKTFNFTGFSPDKLSNIRVAAFVTYLSGNNAKKVLNSIMGSVGDNKDFVQVNN